MSNYDANGGSASQASPIYLEHRLVITTIMTQKTQASHKEAQFTQDTNNTLTTDYDTNGGSILQRSLIHIGNNIN